MEFAYDRFAPHFCKKSYHFFVSMVILFLKKIF